MEMDTLGYHAIILNVNVKYCLLNLRFVCFALSHFRPLTEDALSQILVDIIMNLNLIRLGIINNLGL